MLVKTSQCVIGFEFRGSNKMLFRAFKIITDHTFNHYNST